MRGSWALQLQIELIQRNNLCHLCAIEMGSVFVLNYTKNRTYDTLYKNVKHNLMRQLNH